LKLSILLFDEIEKASDSLWQLLLGILDKATFNTRRQSPRRSFAVHHHPDLNLGASEMTDWWMVAWASRRE